MHNGFLQVEGQKMSKSLGNFFTIDEHLTQTKVGGRTWPGEVLRLAMLKTHYRQPIDWTVRALEEAEATLALWGGALRYSGVSFHPEYKPKQISFELIKALADDLNIQQAITLMHGWGKAADKGDGASAALLFAAGDLLGLRPTVWDRRHEDAYFDAITRDRMEALVNLRLEARRAKNFAESDRIRDELAAMGIQLKDGKDAEGNPVTTWEVRR